LGLADFPDNLATMNISLHPRLEAPAKHGFTGEDVMRMQAAGLLLEGGSFELIGGEIYDMPSEGDAHLALKVALNRFLIRALPDEVALVPDGTLRLGDADWPEPDFYLYPASMRPSAVRGADTLLVIEISDSSLAHDLRLKAALYRQNGVREYWVIDVNAGLLHVHQADGEWPAVAVALTETVEAGLIPGLKVRIADLATS
jgi:Uma2 family endonuclease